MKDAIFSYDPTTGEWNGSWTREFLTVECGTATMLLKTGDCVRVDGGKGMVEILEK